MSAVDYYRAPLLALLALTVVGWLVIWNVARQMPSSDALAWLAQFSNFVGITVLAYVVWKLYLQRADDPQLRQQSTLGVVEW